MEDNENKTENGFYGKTDASGRERAINGILDKLEEGLNNIFDSDNYKAWLNCCSKFHNYSLNNTILIAMQGEQIPGFTGMIAGYNSWQKNFERHVVKGSHGIKILAPAPYKKKEERDVIDPVTQKTVMGADGNPRREEVEITIPAFKPVTVFDACQTEGKDLPQLGVDELKFSVANFNEFMTALEAVSPVPVSFEDIGSGAKGYFSPAEQKIVIQKDMSEGQTVKTFVHELCHSLVDDRDHSRVEGIDNSAVRTKEDKEVTAESVSYIVCNRFDIDTADYSMGYIAGYSSGKDMKELKNSLDTIKTTSSHLISQIEDKLQEILKEKERTASIEDKPLAKVEEYVEENYDRVDNAIDNVPPQPDKSMEFRENISSDKQAESLESIANDKDIQSKTQEKTSVKKKLKEKKDEITEKSGEKVKTRDKSKGREM